MKRRALAVADVAGIIVQRHDERPALGHRATGDDERLDERERKLEQLSANDACHRDPSACFEAMPGSTDQAEGPPAVRPPRVAPGSHSTGSTMPRRRLRGPTSSAADMRPRSDPVLVTSASDRRVAG